MGRTKKTIKNVETCDQANLASEKYQNFISIVESKIIYNQDGIIDWKSMIPSEYIVLNRLEYAKEGVNVDLLSEEDYEKEKSNASDSKKLVRLGGFEYLARLRGVKEQRFKLDYKDAETAVVSCEISFLPNAENPFGLVTCALASASKDNVVGEYSKYLEVIASNRAYTRCVKKALSIQILGQEEIPDILPEIKPKPGSPIDLIKKKCLDKKIDFAEVCAMLQGSGVEMQDSWVNFESLPVPVILTALKLIKTNSDN